MILKNEVEQSKTKPKRVSTLNVATTYAEGTTLVE